MKEDFNSDFAYISSINKKHIQKDTPPNMVKAIAYGASINGEKKVEVDVKLLIIVLILFILAATFQTFAWYLNIDGEYTFGLGLFLSLCLVFFEYLCITKANQWGYSMFSLFQLGMIAELINWLVFILYIKFVKNEEIVWKTWLSLSIMIIAIIVAYI